MNHHKETFLFLFTPLLLTACAGVPGPYPPGSIPQDSTILVAPVLKGSIPISWSRSESSIKASTKTLFISQGAQSKTPP